MSNKQKLNVLENMRLDVPHLRSIDDSVVFDFRSLLKGFVSDTPYVLRGFVIPDAANFVNTQASTIQIAVADSIAWMPGQGAGSFLLVEPGTLNETLASTNSKVIGSFTAGSTNYVSLQLIRVTDPTTSDLVNFWDVDAKVEFSKTVPLGLVLEYRLVVNASGFGTNAPIAVVEVNGSGAVTAITNAKQNLFRLGSGGASPDPYNSYTYAVTPENNLTVTANGQPDPFVGGDFEFDDFKGWMDGVMTAIKNLGGGPFWYATGSSLIPGANLSDLYFDSMNSVITGAGAFVHSDTTPGELTWTSDLKLRSIFGPLTFTIEENTVQLANNEVAYVTLVRNVDFQPTNSFLFTNNSATVTAANTVTGVVAGDFVKFIGHDIGKYIEIQSVAGNIITLVAPYEGATASGKAVMSQGTYSAGDVDVAGPADVPASNNTFWLAKRDDNAFAPLTVAAPGSGGLIRATDVVTLKTTTPHGLVYGQSFALTGANIGGFDGRFEVATVVSPTEISYENPGTDSPSGTAGNGSVTSVAKIYLRGRGGNGELEEGESAQIDDSTILNILRAIGLENESDVTPPYIIVPNALSPYTFNTSYSIVRAISAITGNVNTIFEQLDMPAYDEPLSVVSGAPASDNEITGPVTSGTILTLPTNSRNGDLSQSYTVGKGWLEVFLNGQYLQLTTMGVGLGWTEVGSIGDLSTTIQIDQALSINDVITFRIKGPGGPGSGMGAPDDNFNILPISGTADNADFVLIFDVSIGQYRKQSRATFLSGTPLTPAKSTRLVTADDAYTSLDYMIRGDASGGNIELDLPQASTVVGYVFVMKKVDASSNYVRWAAFAGDDIDGVSTFGTVTQNESFMIIARADGWDVH